jgi:hypothetical protein
VIGAGIGIDNPATRAEYAGAGAPFERRVGRMLESVRAARERVAHAPPFWVGATLAREAALERAGRVFDGWVPTAPGAEAYAAGWKGVRAAQYGGGCRTRRAIPWGCSNRACVIGPESPESPA